ncbi:MAG: glycosyltransferase family 2 protein [Planctomycetota bacterium]
MPKISIVTPSYNQARFLEATIQSVLAQDYPNIEYIVIDGGSTDGSVDIIKKYADKISYWVSEPDRGQSHAINKGFAKATGDIFYWINSDDLMTPSAVKIAMAYLLSNSDIGMLFGDRVTVDAKGNVLSVMELPSFSKKWMKYNLNIPQETAFFRRELFYKVDGLDENLHNCMDFDLWIRFNKIGNLYHIPFILGMYKAHQDTKSGDRTKMRAEIKEVICRHFGNERKKIMKKLYAKCTAVRLFFEKISKKRRRDQKELVRLCGRALM